MGNESNHQIQVGLFVVAGLLVVLGSILIFGGNKSFFKSYFPLRAQFESVQGLAPGSQVTLAGLPVGNVTSIGMVPQSNTLEVVLAIQSEFQNRITEGSIADVRTQGALGDKYIYIEPGPLDRPALAENSLLQTSSADDVLSVITNNTDSLEKFFLTLDEIYKFTHALNEKDGARQLMGNLVGASDQLKRAAGESSDLVRELRNDLPLKDLQTSAAQLNSILTKLNQGEGTLGALINDKTLHRQLKGLLGEPHEKKALNSLMRSTLKKSN